MTCFPDHAVETIVDGFEAAMRWVERCEARGNMERLLADPQLLVHNNDQAFRGDVLAARDAVKKVRDLRTARYLQEPKH